MEHSPKHYSVGLLAAVLLLAWTSLSFAEIKPYSARYSVYRNGILSGKAEVTLQRDDQTWTLRSEGNGTHGLARVLGARDTEENRLTEPA